MSDSLKKYFLPEFFYLLSLLFDSYLFLTLTILAILLITPFFKWIANFFKRLLLRWLFGFKGEARNNLAEIQKIQTSEITIPVISATVLEYKPYDLGDSFPNTTRLYYSPESISSSEFLESVMRSPFCVQTHEKNTNEYNRDVDGMPNKSWYDEKTKTVFAKGFLIGKENIEYVKENKDEPTFGTSAYISFLKLDKEKGVSPEGLEYDVIARHAICNHIAILPNIRDEKNKIVSINAKNATMEVKNQEPKPQEPVSKDDTNAIKNLQNGEPKKMALNQDEFENAYKAMMAKNEGEEAMIERIANAVINKMNAKNEEMAKEIPKEVPKEIPKEIPKEETSNEDDTVNEDEIINEEDEVQMAKNALPNQSLIKDFSNHFGVSFKKTPTFKTLANIAGIKFESVGQAVNAIKSEIASAKNMTAKNSVSKVEKTTKSIDDLLRGF